MRVLHVGPKTYPPNHGGVEKVVYDIVTAMPDVQSHILVQWNEEHRQENVCTLKRGLLSAVWQIRTICRETGCDVVHLHKETFIPHSLLLQIVGVRCVLTVHGCAWRLARWAWYYRSAFFILDCLACAVLRKVVFVGRHDWELFRRLIFFRKLLLIPNGVRLYDADHAGRMRRLVYLGRLSPEKNIVGLIDAADRAGVELDLYGPFDKHDSLFQDRVLAALSKANHVVWKGAIPSEAVQRTLSGYTTFVNASFSEGMPVSVLEAASAGLQLILSDIPQHRLLRFPACTYVAPQNLELHQGMISQEPAESNRVHVRENFSIEQMVHQYLAIYWELAHEG